MQATTVRRSPTAEQLRAWRAFVETAAAMRSAVESRLQDDSGVSGGDYGVLLALAESTDRRMRSSALADTIGWERSRLSHHLGRMERRGLITREECVTDNRGAEIVVTDLGLSTFRRASAPHLQRVQQLFVDALSPAQLRAVEDAMQTLHAHLSVRAQHEIQAQVADKANTASSHA